MIYSGYEIIHMFTDIIFDIQSQQLFIKKIEHESSVGNRPEIYSRSSINDQLLID